MKKFLFVILTVIFIVSLFFGCSRTNIDKNRDASGYIQYIVEFHKRLFCETHLEHSPQQYYPENPALETSFVYGPWNLKFHAQYGKDIVYTVVDPAADSPITAKTFSYIYDEYYESWSNFCEKTDVGGLSDYDEYHQMLKMTISGYAYTVIFEPYAKVPMITYHISTVY